MEECKMPNNDNQNKNPSAFPEGLSSIADDEAITEINLTDFLEENNNGSAPVFDGFGEDIKNTEKSIENELQSLYDDIMGSGPETIVPKPMSVLTSSEPEPPVHENSALGELWMNPEEYFEADIPVVSLDEEEIASSAQESVPQEAFFAPEAAVEPQEETADAAKDDIFSMIDMLKAESDESGFGSILSEIESNEGIAPVEGGLLAASQLVTSPAAYEETDFGTEGTEDLLPLDEAEKFISIPDEAEKAPDENDIDAQINMQEDYESELARILADDEPVITIPEPEKEPSQPAGFVIDIPDDGNDYDAAAAQPEKLYESKPMSGGISYFTQEEYEEKISREEQKNLEAKKKEAPKGKKKATAGDKIRTAILIVSCIVCVVCIGILANTYIISPMMHRKAADELSAQMSENMAQHDVTAVVDTGLESEFPGVDFPDGMLAKYAQLYASNEDLRGWVKIPGYEIDLPVVQGEDNEYYLKKDVFGKYTTYGVPFFDYRMVDFQNLHMNNVIYGHNMRSDDYIFGMLENYRTIEGFEQAPVIECNTIYGDYTWFVYAVFITNAEEEDDNGYFFPYNFIDVSESKFESYIKEIDKRKLYTTGVDINTSDKLLTLSTCSYDFDGARLVVVARLRRDGESVSVDTSKAYENPNPKYPQKWYDVNKKANNPFAEDARW